MDRKIVLFEVAIYQVYRYRPENRSLHPDAVAA
jgi:hypothetical protein